MRQETYLTSRGCNINGFKSYGAGLYYQARIAVATLTKGHSQSLIEVVRLNIGVGSHKSYYTIQKRRLYKGL
jgi:hypothetical protein